MAGAIRKVKPGGRVAIVGARHDGYLFVEGYAVVLRRGEIDDRWRVRFEDGDVVERYVDPEAQADPQGYVARINAELDAARGGQGVAQ